MDEIFKRISVRKYEEKPVEEEKLVQLMKAAMASPSAGNQQPWEFYVVTEKAKIAELSKASQYSGCAANAPCVIVPCYRTEGLRFPEFDQIDTAIATENIWLEATSLGLGAVWLAIAPITERMEKVRAALSLPENLKPFALIPVGYPAESRAQQNRFDENKIHWMK